MKEDVLEQLVDDFLQSHGYLTMHNIKYRPADSHSDYIKSEDSSYSDIDVLGLNPIIEGPKKVVAVSCKSWQSGFNAEGKLRELRGTKKNAARPTWKYFREVWSPKWAAAFRERIEKITGSDEFEYWLAVTRVTGRWSAEEASAEWSQDPTIQANLGNASLKVVPLEEIWAHFVGQNSTTLEASEIGRLAQLLRAAKLASPGERNIGTDQADV